MAPDPRHRRLAADPNPPLLDPIGDVLADLTRRWRRHTSEGTRVQRAFWSKQLRQWHWISSAICLIGMLGFAITGITLNHADQIGATPVTSRAETTLPPEMVRSMTTPAHRDAAVSADIAHHFAQMWSIDVSARAAEWSDDEVYIALPRPGGDASVTIDRESGVAVYERTDRGWIAYLNDLHKGRNTGVAWSWFLDTFAVACVVFSLTGLGLLYIHAGHRPATWPLIGMGLVIPVLIGMLLIH